MFTASKVTVNQQVPTSSYGKLAEGVVLLPNQEAVVILPNLPGGRHVVQFYARGRAYRAIVSTESLATINGKKVQVSE